MVAKLKLAALLFAVVSCLPSFAATTFVDVTGATDNLCTMNLSATGNSNPYLVVVVYQLYQATFTGSPSDGHNVYTSVRGIDGDGLSDTGAARWQSWYAVSTFSGALALTMTGTNHFNNCFALRFLGMGTTPTPHAGAFAVPTTNNFDSGSAATSAGDLRVGYGGNENGGSTCTAGSGWTIPTGGKLTADGFFCVEYDLNAGGGSQDAVMTINQTAGGMSEIFFTPTRSAVCTLGTMGTGPC